MMMTAIPFRHLESPLYQYKVFNQDSPLFVTDVVDLLQAAWSHDYQSRAIFRYDSEFLTWIMAAPSFLGVLALAEDGTPAGFGISVRRHLVFRARTYTAAYGALLSVRPEHQLCGVAERIVSIVAHSARDALGADFAMCAFDQGSLGYQVMQRTIARDPGMVFHLLPPATFWACVYDLALMDQYERFEGPSRVALLPGMHHLMEPRCDDDDLLPPSVLGHEILSPSLSPPRGPRVVYDKDFLAQYPSPPIENGGTLTFTFARNEQCACSYHILKVCKPGLPDHRFGHIQIFDRATASLRNIIRALRHVRMVLLQAGCLGVLFHNTGTLPRAALLAARFLPTPRRICFGLWGRKDMLEPFLSAKQPFHIDLL